MMHKLRSVLRQELVGANDRCTLHFKGATAQVSSVPRDPLPLDSQSPPFRTLDSSTVS